jgi:hypothetical protein
MDRSLSEDIIAMARAAQRDDRLADGALYGKLADEIERLRGLAQTPAVPIAQTGKVHKLKTWPPYFNEVLSGRKPFEWRIDDRDFEVGDTLVLQEYIPNPENVGREGKYTGREITKTVSYLFSPWATNKRTVVMALADTSTVGNSK